MKKEWMVIVNPKAGQGLATEFWEKIGQQLKQNLFDFQFYFTEKNGKTIEQTKKMIENGIENLIVIGGDGTLHEVANGIMLQNRIPSTAVHLGIIPIGTGNDWIKTMNIPNNISEAINIIKNGNRIFQDVGCATYHIDSQVQKRYFINTAGTGLDSIVVEKTNQQKNRSKSSTIAYFSNLLKAFYHYKPVQISIETDDGAKISGKMLSFAVGIGRYNGGGMLPFPNANPTDGLFDGVFINNMSKLKMVFSFQKLYQGTLNTVKETHCFKAKHISINAESPIFLEADGETLGYAPFTFDIIPKALGVFSNATFDEPISQ